MTTCSLHFILFSFVLAPIVVSQAQLNYPDFASKGCQKLLAENRANVFFPGSNGYNAEDAKDNNWSETCVSTSTCLFEPTSAQELAAGVIVLEKTRTQFAVRSGGHMPVPGAANVTNGVLVSMTKFNQITLSSDKNTVSIGSGNRWIDVYTLLSPYGLAVAGGRYGDVGVGGLLLGGGINYFGNLVGWSMNSVVNYEVVLANGTVVDVNAHQNHDLWWALKGGLNNFGIVTRFDMTTIPITQLYGGLAVYSPSHLDDYVNAIADYVAPDGGITDTLSAIDASVGIVSGTSNLSLFQIEFHKGPDPAPKSLAAFDAIPVLEGDVSLRENFSSFATDGNNPLFNGRSDRRLFWVNGLKATPEAVYLANQTLFNVVAKKPIPGLTFFAAYEPVSTQWIQAALDAGGDAFDLDPKNGPLMIILWSSVWTDPAQDEEVMAFNKYAAATLTVAAQAKALEYPFLYINDAGPGQPVFQSYGGGKSLTKLEAIAKAYGEFFPSTIKSPSDEETDPKGVFQTLVPGGFKLPG